MTTKTLLSTVSLALLLGGTAASAQTPINLGHLADYSGATSDVGTPFGQGVADTYAWINKNGGINGAKVNVDTVDYGYQVPRAIAQYKKWSGADKVAAILGWGTADTEALTGFLAEDKIPFLARRLRCVGIGMVGAHVDEFRLAEFALGLPVVRGPGQHAANGV